jgi:hypothetical protein
MLSYDTRHLLRGGRHSLVYALARRWAETRPRGISAESFAASWAKVNTHPTTGNLKKGSRH